MIHKVGWLAVVSMKADPLNGTRRRKSSGLAQEEGADGGGR